MEHENNYIYKSIKHSDENIQSAVNVSEAQSSLKRKRKRSTSKSENKDENQTKILRIEDNLIESNDKDTPYMKCKSKSFRSREKTSQDKDSESTEELQDEDISKKVKRKKKIKFNMMLENDENLTEEGSENKDNYKVEKKNKIKNKIKISKDNDSVKEKTKKSQDKYNDSKKELLSTDTEHVILEYKDSDNNLLTEVEDEKNKEVGNVCEIKESQNKDNDSREKSAYKDIHQIVSECVNTDNNLSTELKNENTCKIKCTDKHNVNKTKLSLEEHSGLPQELKDSDSSQELKDSDSSQELKDSDLTQELENSDSSQELEDIKICKFENEDKDIQRESNNTLKLKSKNQNIKKKMKKSQNENDENTQWENKDTDNDSSGVEEEYYSDVTYLARKIASSQKLNQDELTFLYNIRVQLGHVVLPQHMIETRAGSNIPTRHEIEEFEKIIPIKRGSFSLEEDKIIAKNWKKFCKIHNWDVKKVQPFLHLRINNSLSYMRRAERRKFVQFLSNGLPNRTLYSVYHRFRNLYENNLNRRYKPEEDQMIIDHLEHNPCLDETRKYVDLAKVLRRTRHSIWRRYRLLKKKIE